MSEEKNPPAVSLPPDIPPETAAFLQAMGYLDADRLRVGDPVPPLQLKRMERVGTVRLGVPTTQPTVLIFGSYT
jgi:hypothetical protein